MSRVWTLLVRRNLAESDLFSALQRGWVVRVFVSGKVGEETEAQALMALLRRSGHEVTFDWTEIPHLKPYEQNRDESARTAAQELAGVQEADVLVLMAHERGIGMFVELGAALALRKPVFVFAHGPMKTMFLAHPLVTIVRSVAELIQGIEGISRMDEAPLAP